MAIATILQAISTAALVIGVVFGLVELHLFSRRRQRDSMLELVHSFQTPQFARAVRILFHLPSPLSRVDLEKLGTEEQDSIWLLVNTWESLGVLVHRGEIDLTMVDDFFSGPLLLTWQKIGAYIEEIRVMQNRATIAEWCQWLVERLGERESAEPPIPAHVSQRAWEPE